MNNKFIAAIITLLLLALIIVMCRDASEMPGITPTLSISATPSDTPAPPTATSTTVAPVAVSPLPASGTAVVTSSSTAAVPHTPTPSPTVPARTVTPTPTATAEPLYIVRPGDCLACLSWEWYGTEADWGKIWEVNGKFPKPHEIFPGQELKRPKP